MGKKKSVKRIMEPHSCNVLFCTKKEGSPSNHFGLPNSFIEALLRGAGREGKGGGSEKHQSHGLASEESGKGIQKLV